MGRYGLAVALCAFGLAGVARAEVGVSDTEVVLGMPAAFSGPSAGLGVEEWRGAFAAFSVANDAGGVHGRKVRLALVDNAYDAGRAAPALLKLIHQDRVFAIFGGVGTGPVSRELPVVYKYFLSSGLFYFSNVTGAHVQRLPPWDAAVFNVRASYRQETRAMVDALVATNRKRVGLFVQDDGFGASCRDGAKRALGEHGLKLVGDAIYARGATFDSSMQAQVELLKAARVDAVMMAGTYQACAAFIRDARKAGLDVPIHSLSFVGADQMLELLREADAGSARLTDRLVVTQVVPSPSSVSLPLVREYRAAMDAWAKEKVLDPGVGDGSYKPKAIYSFGSLEGYLNARAFLAVLEKSGRNLTRRGFKAAAEGMGKFELGLGVPGELSPTRHQLLDKVWFTTATEDGWVDVDDPAAILR